MIRYGTSWRGRRPGTRHWISIPIGPIGLILFPFALLFWLGFWGVIAMVWLWAEALLFAVSGALVIGQLAERQGRIEHITAVRLPFGLIMFALIPPPP